MSAKVLIVLRDGLVQDVIATESLDEVMVVEYSRHDPTRIDEWGHVGDQDKYLEELARAYEKKAAELRKQCSAFTAAPAMEAVNRALDQTERSNG